MKPRDYANAIAKETSGISMDEAIASGVCVECKQSPTFFTDAGRREYQISGLCEPCFDRICAEPDDDE